MALFREAVTAMGRAWGERVCNSNKKRGNILSNTLKSTESLSCFLLFLLFCTTVHEGNAKHFIAFATIQDSEQWCDGKNVLTCTRVHKFPFLSLRNARAHLHLLCNQPHTAETISTVGKIYEYAKYAKSRLKQQTLPPKQLTCTVHPLCIKWMPWVVSLDLLSCLTVQ